MNIARIFSKKKFLISLLLLLVLGGGIFSVFFFSAPPRVVGNMGNDIVRDISPNASFIVHFSTAMEKRSTEQAVSFFPSLEGGFSWDNTKTLRFTPKKNLLPGEKIVMSVNQTARSIFRKPLTSAISITYRVVSLPKITMVSPISPEEWKAFTEKKTLPKDEQVPAILKKNQPITVMFDRPIRPLGDAPDTFSPTEYLEFSVPVRGKVRWLGTNAFEFLIDEDSFPNAKTFSIRLRPGIPTIDGGKTVDEITWHVQTAAPKLMSVRAGKVVFYTNSEPKKETFSLPSLSKEKPTRSPSPSAFFEASNVLPDSPIVLEWNMPVELESLFTHMTITPARKIKDDLIIQDQKDKRFVYLEFTPPLARNEHITISISPGVKPLVGDRISGDSSRIVFSTLSNPCLRLKNSEEKTAASRHIAPGDIVSFEFCSLMENSSLSDSEVKNQEEALKKAVRISPKEEASNISFSCFNTICEMSFDAKPNTTYTVSFADGLTDVLGQKIPTDGFSATLHVGDYPPLLSPIVQNSMRSVMDATEEMSIAFSARNIPEVDVTTCIVPPKTLQRIEGNGGWDWENFSCANDGEDIKHETLPLSGEKNKSFVFSVPVYENRETTDVLFWEVSSPLVTNPWNGKTRVFHGVVFPSAIALTVKSGHDFVHVWATDFLSGLPVANLSLALFGHGGKKLDTGKTDSSGLLRLEKPESDDDFFVQSLSSGLPAFVGSGWDNGIAPWDFGIDFDWSPSPRTTGVAFTDRPLYRPKDQVSFKAIVREDFDANFFLPEEKSFSVVVYDSKGNEIFKKKEEVSDFGTLADSFVLTTSAPTGRYYLSVRRMPRSEDDREGVEVAQAVFWVEEYKKPVFFANIDTPKKEYIRGEDIAAKLNASYFFGAPLSQADVSWHVIKTPLIFDRWSGAGWFSFGTDESKCFWECPAQEEVVAKGEGKTDSHGVFSFDIPVNETENMLYTIRATITNANKQTVTIHKTVPIFAAEYVIGIRANDFSLDSTSEKVSAQALITDLSGRGIPGKRFTAKLQKVVWNSIKKQGIDGSFYWENTKEIRDLDILSASSGIGGKATISFPLKNTEDYFGQLRILVSVEDSKKNEVSASDFVWRTSDEFSVFGRQENTPRFGLELQSPEVRVGEDIVLLPESPFAEEVPALITVERQNILFQKVLSLRPGEPIAIPTTTEMIPNAFVSVVLSKGKGEMGKIAEPVRAYHQAKKEIEEMEDRMDSLRKKIDTIVAKMETATGDVLVPLEKALNRHNAELAQWEEKKEAALSQQKRARGEIFLALGKEVPIPSLTDVEVFPEQKVAMVPVRVSAEERRLSLAIIPDKERYLPGETVSLTIKVRDALGQPVPTADLSVAVVDASLLALKSRQDEDIFSIFYRLRGLGVRTASSMTQFFHRHNVRSKKGAKGGGGLGGMLDLLAKKRGEFRDTAFWSANTQTDGTGKAKVQFRLPDNATTWQVWVTANTIDSRFGSTKKNFLSQKPLLVSPILPRFFIAGDTARVGFSVHNQSDTELVVKPTFTVENADIVKQDDRSVRIAPGVSHTVSFTLRVPYTKSDSPHALPPVRLTMNALGDRADALDSMEVSLPVFPPAVATTFATSNTLTPEQSSAQEHVFVSEDHLPALGGLSVFLSSGILGDITHTLTSLSAYPYGCTEQILSAFLPTLMLARLQEETGYSLLPEDIDISSAVSALLQKLYDRQKSDGGFGFWADEKESSPFLSAYVLYGLEEIGKAGHTVDEQVIVRVRRYLSQKLLEDIRTIDMFPAEIRRHFADYDTRAFATYALSLGSKLDSSLISSLYQKRFSLSSEGKAFLLLAALNTLSKEDQTINHLVKLLEAEAHQEDRTASFSAGKNAWNFSSDIRATAVATIALFQYDTSHPLLPKLAQFLRDTKTHASAGGGWGTTQDTAWALHALSYLARTAKPSDAPTTVAINRTTVFDDILKKTGVPQRVDIATDTLRAGEVNTIDITTHDAFATYDIVYTEYLPVDDIMPVSRGFGIMREYVRREDDTPVSSFRVGDIVREKVTLLVPENHYFVGVTLPLPAGMEAINFALETENASLKKFVNTCEHYWCPGDNIWRFSHREYRDDRVFLFAEYLPAGRYEFTYLARVTTVGTFSHLPARIEEMYHPEVFARTKGEEVRIMAKGKRR